MQRDSQVDPVIVQSEDLAERCVDMNNAFNHPIVAAAMCQLGAFVVEVDHNFNQTQPEERGADVIAEIGADGGDGVSSCTLSQAGRGNASEHATDPAFLDEAGGP